MTTDVDRAAKFLLWVFGWTTEVMPMPEVELHTSSRHRTRRGHLAITPQMGERAALGTYFTVKRRRRDARKAVQVGAKALHDMKNVRVCRFCGITSPQVSRSASPQLTH